MPSTVLIITNDHDEHATAVIRELARRNVGVFRFHPEDLPDACSVSLEVQAGRIQGEIRAFTICATLSRSARWSSVVTKGTRSRAISCRYAPILAMHT